MVCGKQNQLPRRKQRGMIRKNAILIPLSLTLSHLGEGISGNPTASGWDIQNIINI
jgi:hypothetical protein